MKSCHFIGICGAGMSAVAKLLKDQGWLVSGSDAGFYPPVSDALLRAGLTCTTPHAPSNIPPDVTLIVIGKHAKLRPELNDEVKAAFAMQDQGKAIVRSFPDILHDLTLQSHNIVVAGSYGKSTTAALVAWILTASKRDPSYFIGAIPLDMQHSSHTGSGKFFVLEGDEYPTSNWDASPKFLHYNAKTVILTSGEYDHFNEFKDEAAYVEVYKQLVQSLAPDSLLIACLDGQNVDQILAEAKCKIVTYSIAPTKGAAYSVEAIEHVGPMAKFLIRGRKPKARRDLTLELSTSLLGSHNIQNITGAVAALLELDAVTPEEIIEAVKNFSGLRRRLELKKSIDGISLYEDLSSSRPKAMAALDAVRQRYPTSCVIAIFQPHTFSFRSQKALDWYPGMFANADHVLVLSPPGLQGLAAGEELSHEEIVDAIRAGNNCHVQLIRHDQELKSYLDRHMNPSTVVVVMSSGAAAEVLDSVRGEMDRKSAGV